MRCGQLLMEEYWHSHNNTVALDYDGLLFSTVSATSPCEMVPMPQSHGHTHLCHTATQTCPVRCVSPSVCLLLASDATFAFRVSQWLPSMLAELCVFGHAY